MTTERLMVRPPRETDRDQFVELFCNEEFMVFSGVLTEEQARDRFDRMVAVCRSIPFGNQPVVELASGRVVGYTGVDHIDIEGKTGLEWGYRLVSAVSGSRVCHRSQSGSAGPGPPEVCGLLAIIAPENLASQNVCRKLGFTFWKQAPVEGEFRNLYTLAVA